MTIAPEDEFEGITLKELMLAIMADGRWYTATVLRRRVRRYKGSVTATLHFLREGGYIRRARNPLWQGRKFVKDWIAPYAYQATGKPFKGFNAGFKWSKAETKAARLQWLRDRGLPPWWRRILK